MTSLIRNIGIIAHIDAGKTSLTERLLHHAGLIKRAGSVDHGDTVMDFLPEERERGITIKAACITIPFGDFRINLIDTPGHVDFTVEVERAVRVMDGAVTVLDGSAGVQAQTVTVWEQARRFGVSQLVFVNKLDKIGADFNASLKDIQRRLKVPILPMTEPVYEGGELVGVYDILSKTVNFQTDTISNPFQDGELKRQRLLESVAEHDETFLESYIDDQHQSDQSVISAIRRIVASRVAVPVFAGSAMKDIGCKRLFKDIVDYIPTPKVIDSNRLTALAFKVVSDEQKGLLTFVRLYSGKLNQKSIIYGSGKSRDRVQKLMRAHGQEFVELSEAGPGDIVVIGGCREVATGDTISDSANFTPLPGVSIPHPVFHMAVSTNSTIEQEHLEETLRIMNLEDPSLKVTKDLSTGQTILAGMGELHLEISRNRLCKFYKCAADFGPVRIAFKETILESVKGELQYQREVNNIRHSALVSLQIEPLPVDEEQFVKLDVIVDIIQEGVRVPKNCSAADFVQSVKDGVHFALLNGPLRGSPVTGVKVIVKKIHWIDHDSTPVAVRHATVQLVTQLLRSNENRMSLIEPVMSITAQCPNEILGTILADLHGARRAHVHNYAFIKDDPDSDQIIEAEAPLSELMGYVTWLRSVTSGRGCLTMSLKGYKYHS